MSVLKILQYPDPALKEVCAEVNGIDSKAASFIRDLIDTMRASPGVGLAAPQLGVLLRVITIDVTPKQTGHGLITIINPVIVSSKGGRSAREGCLSIPEYTANIRRAEEIAVKGLFYPEEKEAVIESTGLEAVALQHEIDHLDGILFIDRIVNMKRDLFKRRIKEL